MRNSLGDDIKIIIVGNYNSGKTAFVERYVRNKFSEIYKPTIMSEFAYKTTEIESKSYRIHIWDLAGHDNSKCITKIFCKASHGAIIITDILNRCKLDEVLNWKKAIEETTKFIDNSNVPIILIENKVDLDENFKCTEHQIQEFSKKNNFLASFSTSAKTGYNINESMNFLLKEIIDKLENCFTSLPFYAKNEKSFILEKTAITNYKRNLKKDKCC